MDEPGCDVCRQWGPGASPGRAVRRADCAASFQSKASYFYASLWACPTCGTRWLEGYYEDFSDRPIEAEWGDRHWIWHSLTEDQVDQIGAARGMRTLDIDTFGT